MTDLNLSIGAQVHCQDKICGKLHKIVVDPRSHRVTDIVLERGLLHRKDCVLPVSVVERATGQDIYLSVRSDELEGYREYREIDFSQPAPGWGESEQYQAEHTLCWFSPYGPACFEPAVPVIRRHAREGISPTQEVIGRDMSVRNHQGHIGEIDHFLVNPETDEITDLVVRRGLPPQHAIIPVSMIEDISEKGVLVNATNDQVEELAR